MELTFHISECWNVIVVQWTSWTVFGDVLEVLNQIFLNHWVVEQVWHDENGRDANLFGMFGQIAHISDVCTADLNHQDQVVFPGNLPPFFGEAFAFIDAKSCSFANGTVEQNTIYSLLFQQLSVFFDDIVVYGFPVWGEIKLKI